MKNLNVFWSMLAALFLFACTSNEIPVDPDSTVNSDRVVKINVDQLSTKAEQPGTLDNTYTKVEDGVIYFFKDGGSAVFAYRLTGDDITTLSGALNGTLKDITVTGVPLSANRVVLITNLNKANKTYPPFAGNTLSTIKGFAFDIKEQQPVGGVDTPYPVAEVIMSGEANIIVDGSVTPSVNKAAITIAPVLSRLEVGAVRCKNVPGTVLPATYGEGQITKFRLNGIFITNHYELGTVFGIGQNAPYKPTDPVLFSNSFKNGLFDFYTNPNTLTKGSTKYFAYHTFPSVNTSDMPNIVVAVDNVWYKDLDGKEKVWKNGAVQFFTIEKFKNGNAYLNNFVSAKIYRIIGEDPGVSYIAVDASGNVILDTNGNPVIYTGPSDSTLPSGATVVKVTIPGGTGGVEFGIDDLTDKPYDKNKTVECSINILPWNLVVVTPAK
ncbi:MAG: hypothetical protein ACRC77_09920 [Bacteroidales bacterium]